MSNIEPAAPSEGTNQDVPRQHVYRRNALTRTQVHHNFFKKEASCHLKDQCGACRYVNQDYKQGLKEKHAAGLAHFEGLLEGTRVVAPVESPRQLGYRAHFKLAVRHSGRGFEDRFAIGLFKPGTHSVIDIDSCPLHSHNLKNLLRDLRHALNESELVPYDENMGSGQLRYITAREAHLSGELLLTFVATTQEILPALKTIVFALRRIGHKINAAHLNLNTDSGNNIYGNETVKVLGNEFLRERMVGFDVAVSPTGFFQINPWQAANLYRRIEQIAGYGTPGSVAWDFYCGSGVNSLMLARAGFNVLGIEENPSSVVNATDNASKNDLAKETTFLAGRVEDLEVQLPSWAADPSVIVVNPSRRGMAPSTRVFLQNKLASLGNTRLVYVSCSAETLARDLATLKESGLKLRQLESFDMFPQTGEMEWLAVLAR